MSVALAAGSLAAILVRAASGAQEQQRIPDFSSKKVAWIAINSDFSGVPGSPPPVTFDPKHPFVRNDQSGQATYRVADLSNPNLKPWVVEELRKANNKVLAAGIGPTPRWSCLPGGVPGFTLFVIEPVYIVQGPKEVLLDYSGNHEIRHVYLDVPHTKDPKPSWYGESIGHYEGDTPYRGVACCRTLSSRERRQDARGQSHGRRSGCVQCTLDRRTTLCSYRRAWFVARTKLLGKQRQHLKFGRFRAAADSR